MAGELDVSDYVNLHEIQTRARLADVSAFYREQFDGRAVEDVDALSSALEELAQAAIERIEEAEEAKEAAEKEEAKALEAMREAEGERDFQSKRAGDAEREAESLRQTLAALRGTGDGSAARLAEAHERIRELEAELAAARSAPVEPAPERPKARAKPERKRPTDPTILIELKPASDVAPSKPARASSRKRG